MAKITVTANYIVPGTHCNRIEMTFDDGSTHGINLPEGMKPEEIEGQLKGYYENYMTKKAMLEDYKTQHAGKKPHEDVKKELDW